MGRVRKRSKTARTASEMFGWSGDNGGPGQLLRALLWLQCRQGRGNVFALVATKDFETGPEGQARDQQADRAALYMKAQEISERGSAGIPICALGAIPIPVRKE